MPTYFIYFSFILILFCFPGCGSRGIEGALTPPEGEKLFQTKLSLAQLSAARQWFAETRGTQMVAPVLVNPLYQLDVQSFVLDGFTVPQAPVFGTYDYPGGSAGLAIKLPHEFLFNISEKIKNEIKKRDIQAVDLFLVVQKYDSRFYNSELAHVVRLRPHFWLAPLGPHPYGTCFSGNFSAALYDFESSVGADVKLDQLTQFDWSIHPATVEGVAVTQYSPPNASVNIGPAILNHSGWSLILDEQNHRAAVTLHGIYSDARGGPYDNFQAVVDAHFTLRNIITHLDLNPVFAGLLAKLTAWVQ